MVPELKAPETKVTKLEPACSQEILESAGPGTKGELTKHEPPSFQEILKGAGPDAKGEVKPFTPIQRAGLYLALGVGLAIALTTSSVILDWFLTRPDLPSFAAGTPEQAAKVIQNFKELNAINLDRATSLFDLVVVKAFLPVFTAILGYIFGTRAEGGG